jgi:hypothetical protein
MAKEEENKGSKVNNGIMAKDGDNRDSKDMM